MRDLFEDKRDFRIVRISEHDALVRSDSFLALRSKIMACEEMYPSIKTWIDNKVIKGLTIGERVGYLGYYGDVPIASAIVKKGENAKFCHLKIDSEIQDKGLGDVFFSLMALEVRSSANTVHFTLPESLWEHKMDFFNSFSFIEANKCHQQYRLFEEELRTEADYHSVHQSVLQKINQYRGITSISGFSMDTQLILSVQPEYAEKIMLGKKTVEVRRKFSKSWEGVRFNLYASSPRKCLMGEAKIERVIESSPEIIWEHFSTQVACSKQEFDNYTYGADKVYALVLNDIKPYMYPIHLTQIEHLLRKNLNAPQSYSVVGHNDDWINAISMAAILQASAQQKKSAKTEAA